MKKTLSLLTLTTLIATFSGMAQAENLFVINNSMTNSLKVVVTDNGVDKDTTCIPVNSMAYFTNYEVKHSYDVKIEHKSGYYCDGNTTKDEIAKVNFYNSDMEVLVDNYRTEVSPR